MQISSLYSTVPVLPPQEVSDILAQNLPPSTEDEELKKIFVDQRVQQAFHNWINAYRTILIHIPRLTRHLLPHPPGFQIVLRMRELQSKIMSSIKLEDDAKLYLINWKIGHKEALRAELAIAVCTLVNQCSIDIITKFIIECLHKDVCGTASNPNPTWVCNVLSYYSKTQKERIAIAEEVLEKDPDNFYTGELVSNILFGSKEEFFKTRSYKNFTRDTMVYLKGRCHTSFAIITRKIIVDHFEAVMGDDSCPDNPPAASLRMVIFPDRYKWFASKYPVFFEQIKDNQFLWIVVIPRLSKEFTKEAESLAKQMDLDKIFRDICNNTYIIFPCTMEFWMPKFQEREDFDLLFANTNPCTIVAALPWWKPSVDKKKLIQDLLNAIIPLKPVEYAQWASVIAQHFPEALPLFFQQCQIHNEKVLIATLPTLMNHGFSFDVAHPWISSIITFEDLKNKKKIVNVIVEWFLEDKTGKRWSRYKNFSAHILATPGADGNEARKVSLTSQALHSPHMNYTDRILLLNELVDHIEEGPLPTLPFSFIEYFDPYKLLNLPYLSIVDKITFLESEGYIDLWQASLPKMLIRSSIVEFMKDKKEQAYDLAVEILELYNNQIRKVGDKQQSPMGCFVVEAFSLLDDETIVQILKKKNHNGIAHIDNDQTWKEILSIFRVTYLDLFTLVYRKLDRALVISKELAFAKDGCPTNIPFESFREYLPYIQKLDNDKITQILLMKDSLGNTLLHTNIIPAALLLQLSPENIEKVLTALDANKARPAFPFDSWLPVLAMLDVDVLTRILAMKSRAPYPLLPSLADLKELSREHCAVIFMSKTGDKRLFMHWLESGLLDGAILSSTLNITIPEELLDKVITREVLTQELEKHDHDRIEALRLFPLSQMFCESAALFDIAKNLSLQALFGEVAPDVYQLRTKQYIDELSVNPSHMQEGVSMQEATPKPVDMNEIPFLGKNHSRRYSTSYAFLDDMLAAAKMEGCLESVAKARLNEMRNKITTNQYTNQFTAFNPFTRRARYDTFCAFLSHIVVAYKIGQPDGDIKEKTRILNELGEMQMNCIPRWIEQIQQMYFSRPGPRQPGEIILTLKDRLLELLRCERVEIIKSKLNTFIRGYVHETNYLCDIFRTDLGTRLDPINDRMNVEFKYVIANYPSKIELRQRFDTIYYTKEYLINIIQDHLNAQKKREENGEDPIILDPEEVEQWLELQFRAQWTVEQSNDIIKKIRAGQNEEEIKEIMEYYGIVWDQGLTVKETEIQLTAQLKGIIRSLESTLKNVRSEIEELKNGADVDVRNLIERYSQITKNVKQNLDEYKKTVDAWEKKLQKNQTMLTEVLGALTSMSAEEKIVYLKEKGLLKEGMKLEEVLQHNHIRNCQTRRFIEEEVYDAERLFTQKAAAYLLVSCGVLTAT